MSIKLSDTQFVLLSRASNRSDGSLLPAPERMAADPRRLKTVLSALVRRGFALKSDDLITITDAGYEALGIDRTPQSKRDLATGPEAATSSPDRSAIRPATKTALLIGLLSRNGGATLDDLMGATNWQPHTVRAALSGLRRKGHIIHRSRHDGCSHYRRQVGA